jgi:hypothetical protein
MHKQEYIMSDTGTPATDVTEQGATEQGATETPQNSKESADNSQRLEKLEKDFQELSNIAENLKNDNSAKDRKINELIKEKKEHELSQMSDADRQKELDKLREDKVIEANDRADKAESEASELRRSQAVSSSLSKAGLSVEKFSKFITAKEPELINKQVEELATEISEKATTQKQTEINQIMSGNNPASDSSSSNDFQTMYAKAKSRNDVALMTAIKREAAKLGTTINY